MREGKQLDVGVPRQLRRLEGRRVRGLASPVAFLVEKGRLVDEHVGSPRRFQHGGRDRRVACEHELAAGARRAEHGVGRDRAPVRQRYRLAVLELAAVRTRGNAERVRRLDVEAPRPRPLDDGVPHRGDSVCDRKGDDRVLATLQDVARAQLDELELVAQLSEDPPQRAEQVDEPGRPVDRQPDLAAAQREGFQHPRQPEVVVGVVVRQEHLAQLDETDRRAQELALRPLGAVEEQPLAAPADEQRGRRPLRGRHRAGRPEEDEIEIHGRPLILEVL